MSTSTHSSLVPEAAPRSARRALKLMARLPKGQLRLVLPTGQTLHLGQMNGPTASIRIQEWAVFDMIISSGDVGFAEAFRRGWWDTNDLTGLLRLALVNRRHLEDLIHGHWLGNLLNRIQHWMRRNTKANSKRNIQAHYDLGNAFYSLWLDETMMYSAAHFDGDLNRPLAQAQTLKIERTLKQAGVSAGSRVLEIGCGWGGLAEVAARDFGAQVVGLTLSPAQLTYAQERLQKQGLQADLRLQDYRDIHDGPFDAVCSIEMFEAVGQAYWPTYFKAVSNLLASGGKACIQTITIDDALFERYLQGTDFIQQYIFPGGCLPSPSEFRRQAQAAGLRVVDEFSLRLDYAETLRRWHSAFNAKKGQVQGMGFDDVFLRTWQFYLSYCEAGFEEASTDVIQFTLVKD